MNWSDDEVDKLFQESSSQLNVPYQDSFWDEMEALLPAVQKSRRGIGWIWGGFMTCLLLIGTLFIPFRKAETPALGRANAAQPVSRTSNVSMHPQHMAATAPRGSGQMTARTSDLQNISTTRIPTILTASEVASPATRMQPPNTQTSAIAAQQPATPATLSARIISAAPVAGNTTVLSVATLASATLTENANDNTSASEAQAASEITTAAITTTSAAETASSDAVTTAENDAAASEISNLPARPVQTLPAEVAGTSLLKSAFNFPEHHSHIYVQLGLGIGQSYLSGTQRSAMMPTITFGSGYQYDPNGWGFSAGLALQSAFPSNLEITQRTKTYGFGVTSYQQNLHYTQLYTVEMPVSIQYKKGRHTFSAGFAPTYLAGTLMNLSRSENDEEQEDRWYLGKKQGLQSWGLKPTLAYQLKVGKLTTIGMQLNVQVIHQIDPVQFSGSHTSLPLNGQVTLRRTLSR
jgi:hypothetical protein